MSHIAARNVTKKKQSQPRSHRLPATNFNRPSCGAMTAHGIGKCGSMRPGPVGFERRTMHSMYPRVVTRFAMVMLLGAVGCDSRSGSDISAKSDSGVAATGGLTRSGGGAGGSGGTGATSQSTGGNTGPAGANGTGGANGGSSGSGGNRGTGGVVGSGGTTAAAGGTGGREPRVGAPAVTPARCPTPHTVRAMRPWTSPLMPASLTQASPTLVSPTLASPTLASP